MKMEKILMKKLLTLIVGMLVLSLLIAPAVSTEIKKTGVNKIKIINKVGAKTETAKIQMCKTTEEGLLVRETIDMPIDEINQLVHRLKSIQGPFESFDEVYLEYYTILNEAGIFPSDVTFESLMEQKDGMDDPEQLLPILPQYSNAIDNTRCLFIFAGVGLGLAFGSRNLLPYLGDLGDEILLKLLGVDLVSAWIGIFLIASLGERGFVVTETLDLLLGGTLGTFMLLYSFPVWDPETGVYGGFIVCFGVGMQILWYPFF